MTLTERRNNYLYWLILIRASCDILFLLFSPTTSSSSLLVAFLHFACECVVVCRFGFLLFVLFLYWYIMEEFELPWAIVSFPLLPVLFCFESCCVCECVVVMVVKVRLCLYVCVCLFVHVQLKPTLNKRKKVRNEPRCFSFVWLRVCVCVDESVWVNLIDFTFPNCVSASLNSVTLWNFSQTVPSRSLFLFWKCLHLWSTPSKIELSCFLCF